MSQDPGWCRTLIALLLRSILVSVRAPYEKNVPVAGRPKKITLGYFLRDLSRSSE